MNSAEFMEKKRAVSTEVDSIIVAIDAGVPEGVMQDAEKAIKDAGDDLTNCATARMAHLFQEAAAGAGSSVAHLGEIATSGKQIEAQMAELPETGAVMLAMALFYLIAAGAAFLTELALTRYLTDLLKMGNGPLARAVGIAFASSLLVFELIFIKLRLVDDPWAMFSRSEKQTAEAQQQSMKVWRRLRIAGAVSLVLVLIGIGLLTVVTVVKIAPTREIDAEQLIHPQVDLPEADKRVLKESVLFFSVCILISGGFLMASATWELRTFFQHVSLKRRISQLERDRQEILEHLDKLEKPRLAAALISWGMPYLWLQTTSPETLMSELRDACGDGAEASVDAKLRTSAQSEIATFTVEKRIALAKARLKPPPPSPQPPPRPRRSTVDLVEDIIREGG